MHALDHVVFNTRDQMDQCVALFARLGFTVAPRGVHTLGSINHLLVFGRDYFELLGYPAGRPPEKRPELVANPVGLMATVLATDNADATHAQLTGLGLAPRPVQSFSRPVELDGGRIEHAAFRVTRLEPQAIPGSWFYYCQHLTPQLVWRPEWQAHANGATGMAAIDIAVQDLAQALPAYARATLGNPLQSLGGSASSAHHASGAAAVVQLRDAELRLHQAAGPERMTGITFRTDSLATVRNVLCNNGVDSGMDRECLTVDPAATSGIKIQFTE